MSWVILIISAVFESIWAIALGESAGFSRTVPTVIFLLALTVSMAGLGIAAKTIPIGTAYAVWVGIGAALTVTYSIASGHESFSPLKLLFISGIILAVVGLKLVSGFSDSDKYSSQSHQN